MLIVLLLTFCLEAIISGKSYAQEKYFHFSVSSGAVDKVLINLARQAQSPLLLPSKKIEAIQAQAVM